MLPLALRFTNKRVLLIGAGPVAWRRAQTLLTEGALLDVVAPVAIPEIQDAAVAGRLNWHARKYSPADLNGAWLVFAHTDSAELNRKIAVECQQQNIWCLTGGNHTGSDIWMMAHAHPQKDLTVAVTAHGNPRRAKDILRRILATFANE